MLISGFVRDARKKLRPMRPKPLIPTLITVCFLATHGALNEKAQTLKYAFNLPQRWGLGANTISDYCVNSSVIKALIQQIRGKSALSIRNAELPGSFISHRQ